MKSATETIEITGLPPGTKKALEEIGRSKGQTGEEFARTLIEAELLSLKTFDEILAPVRQSFRESGMTEDELDALVEEAREKVRQERSKENV